MMDLRKLPNPETLTEDELMEVCPSVDDFSQSRDRIVELEAFYWAVGHRLRVLSGYSFERHSKCLLDHATALYGTLQPRA